MARKTFTVSVSTGGIVPTSHRIRMGDEIEWTLDKGKAVVVFEPEGPSPASFSNGPNFTPLIPALATAQRANTFPFFVCCWHEQGGRKNQSALAAVLIIDP